MSLLSIIFSLLISITSFGRGDGLTNLMVRDIACDKNGEIWVATRDGLNRFDGYSFVSYRTDPDNPSSIGCNVLECLDIAENGLVWIGSDEGFSCYDPYVRKFKNYSVPKGHVLDIIQLDGSTLYLRTGSKSLFFDIPSQSYKERFCGLPAGDGIYYSFARVGKDLICSDSDYMLSVSGSRIDTLCRLANPAREIVPAGDTLWLCRNDNALHTFNRKTGDLEQYKTAGIYGKTRDVEIMGECTLFATNTGLVIVHKDASSETMEVFPSDKPDYHLPVNCLETDLQGGVWISSFHNGLALIAGNEEYMPSPDPIITGISIDGEDLLPARGGTIDKDIRYLDKIHLRKAPKELRINFSVVNMASLGRNNFRYRLEGAEDVWHDQDNRSAAVYKDLKSGTYRFVLKSSNPVGKWSENERELEIRIGRHIERAVAIVLTLLLISILVIFHTRRKRSGECFVVSSMTEGLSYRFEGKKKSEIEEESIRFIEKAVKKIEDNIRNADYSSTDLARDLGVSRSSLYSKVSEPSGLGIGELMSMIRLTQARHMMESGVRDLDEIAEATGFSSRNYFSTCFKKKFGKSPKSFFGIAVALLLIPAGSISAANDTPVFREVPLPKNTEGKQITAMVQDKDGFLWLSEGKQILRFDGKSFDTFYLYSEGETEIKVNGITRDQDGRIWALTSEGPRFFNSEIQAFSALPNAHKTSVFGIADIGDGKILIASSVGTGVFDIEKGIYLDNAFPREDLRIKAVSYYGNKIDLLGENGGLYRWNYKTDNLEFVGSAGQIARDIKFILDNMVWITDLNGNSSLYRIEKGKLEKISKSMDARYFTRGEETDLKYIDDKGGMWSASKDGKLYYSFKRESLLGYLPGEKGENAYSTYVVGCIAVEKNGSIWLGRPGDGNILRYDSSSGKTETFVTTEASDAKCIIPLDGEILVGFYYGGLQSINLKSGTFTPIPGLKVIRTAVPLDNDRILLTSNKYPYVYNRGNGSISPIEIKGWRSSYAKKMFVSSTGNLWVASERGLQLFVPSGNSFVEETAVDLSPIRRATDITEDATGKIWITAEYGLWSFNPTTRETFEFDDPDHILYKAVLYSIEKDRSGRLWIAGSNNIYSVNPSNGNLKKYSDIDGYTCQQFTAGNSCICSDGSLLFAGVGGITRFNPDKYLSDAFDKRPVLMGMEQGGNGGEFTISINVPDISSSENYGLVYSIDSGAEFRIESVPALLKTDRLKAGQHLLRVRSVNEDGEKSLSELTVPLQVKRKSGLVFYIIFGALAAVLAIAGILIHKEYSKKKRKDGFLEKARNAVGNHLSDKSFTTGVMASEMGVSHKELLAGMAAYAESTPLEFIRDTRIEAAKKMLKETSLSISEIGEKTGFGSASYFVMVFRKQTGIPPFRYRKSLL